jgi:2-succinyl-5-enolpyruvyl-6-hydroxy-3-cyclohexene-1-carboxylate synthase
MSSDAAATFCATLVDEWVRCGVRHAVVAPGSRSTPLAIALADRAEVQLHVFLDERSASFAALGVGLATGDPAILLCTSGTAAAEFHAAVVEAHQAEVPLIVCTADRPPELRDTGAPQTIDQMGLFGGAVRWFHDPGVADLSGSSMWRSLGARAVADSRGPRPGPVHLNLPFREPLLGTARPLPPGRDDAAPWHRTLDGVPALEPAVLSGLATLLEQPRGVIVAGGGAGEPSQVHALAEATSWPVLADPRSGCRLPLRTTVAAFDDLLRHERFASDHRPRVVLRLGQPPASKVLAQWLAASGATQVQVSCSAAWSDPAHDADVRVVAEPGATCAALSAMLVGATGTPWLARWSNAEERAQHAIMAVLGEAGALTEPAISRSVMEALPDGSCLVVSSSMPIRDVEWYSAPRSGVRVLSNRGANGIDGVTSTALGVALATGRPTALLIGDVAFLHDSTALISARDRAVDLAIVVVDNDGGGIFSFLTQASALPTERFEQLFGTPHGTDLRAIAAAHGLAWTDGEDGGALRSFVASGSGVRIMRVRTDRRHNVGVHEAVHEAVRRALG